MNLKKKGIKQKRALKNILDFVLLKKLKIFCKIRFIEVDTKSVIILK